ncbi:MAG TPA: hypothetical protein VMJ93_03705 [Verrucomicrobiae bacterium]|nr:hypothetical protein [Verrucomicrobiae bacterium]
MTSKTRIPVKSLGSPLDSSPKPQDHAAIWGEAIQAYPLYSALAAQFKLAALPHPEGELPPARPTREIFDADLKWLDGVDETVRAYQIRQLPSEILNASSDALRAFIHRQLRKSDKTTADRDKIDLLLVQYFALCAPESLYRSEINLEDVAQVLQPVLAEADATPLEWCEPLDSMLSTVDHCQSLRDLLEQGVLEKGRMLKESAGAMFYDPAALVAFCRFNFLVRRAFIRLLHADLAAVMHAIDALDAGGVKTVDCRRAGFSAAETTSQLRYYAENWRQPFHKDYTESSVSHAFEQLLALRADLEDAVTRFLPASADPRFGALIPTESTAGERGKSTGEAPVPFAPSFPGASEFFAKSPEAPASSQPTPAAATPPAAPPAASAPQESSAAGNSLEAEKCLETIWEQLIAAPPSRGRSMSTVVLRDTKVLLSSWEVAAFVSEGDQEAEDLRRAVVARALLAVAMDGRKRSGDLAELASSITLARTEVSYFQGRVEAAKRSKNTEAAVNLGISTKRLLSVLEEAEKLQP